MIDPRASLAGSAALVALTAAVAGCSHHVYSPPARAFPLETVAPVGEGRTGVQLEGGYHDITWGADAVSGTGRVRYGVHEEIDMAAEVMAVHIDGDSAAGTSPNIYAARVGGKARVMSFMALAAGIGAGTSAGGPYASPDLGIIAAYENRYVVPFYAVRGFASQPFGAREVDTTEEGEPVGTHVDKPRFTRGLATSAGARLLLPWGAEEPTWALSVGGGVTVLADNAESDTMRNLGGGLELMF